MIFYTFKKHFVFSICLNRWLKDILRSITIIKIITNDNHNSINLPTLCTIMCALASNQNMIILFCMVRTL